MSAALISNFYWSEPCGQHPCNGQWWLASPNMYVPSQLPLHHFQTIFLHYVLFFRELFCSMIYSLPLRLLFSYLLSCPVTHAVLYCPLLHLTISLSYVSFTTCSPKSCILFVFHIYIYTLLYFQVPSHRLIRLRLVWILPGTVKDAVWVTYTYWKGQSYLGGKPLGGPSVPLVLLVYT